jgi:hypothetical protein
MQLPWALTAASRKYARRLAARMALACAGAAAGVVGTAFATAALFAAIRAQYDVIDASAAIAALYLILAGVLFAWRGVVGTTEVRHGPVLDARQLARGAADAATKQIDADAAQTATLALGMNVARQLTPMQLILLAALTGFVAGRKI